jgi:hypothetical protein
MCLSNMLLRASTLKENQCLSLQVGNFTECRVLKGTTSILLDNNSGKVEQLAYFVIGRALNDPTMLESYTTMQITQAELLQPVSDKLVVLTTDSNNGQASFTGTSPVVKAALASAAVSFALTVAIAYFMCVRRRSVRREKADGKSRLFHLQAKHRKFFEELHDEESNAGLESGWMVTDSSLRSPSITWSVSDLTTDSIDDSQSIRSTQSIRSSLPLDRIMEALTDEEIASNESDPTSRGPERHGRHDMRFDPRWDGEAMEQLHLESTGHQCITPPHGFSFRSKSVSGTIVDVSLSLTPSTPPSAASSEVEQRTYQDLDSICVSLEGCQYLENDVETSDEVDCSFNSDPTQGLDVPVRKLGPVDVRNEGMMDITPDEDLLFSDDELDLMELGDEFEKVWSVPDHGCGPAGNHAAVEKGASRCLSDDDASEHQQSLLRSIERRLELSKTQRLLTY